MHEGWDRFAASEPYFAVLTEPRYLKAHFDAAAESDFFDSGEVYVEALIRFIRSHGSPLFQPENVLEYGCGPGRLVLPFARRAASVLAIDISPAMRTVAERHVRSAGLSNVTIAAPETLERITTRFHLVNCALVLQRMRRTEGLALVRRLAQLVRNGGFLVLHVPYRSHASGAQKLTRSLRARVPGVNAAVNLLRRKPASTPLIESNAHELAEVLAILQQAGFQEPHLSFGRDGDLDSVLVHAQRRGSATSAAEPEPALEVRFEEARRRDAQFIDVRQLIEQTSIEQLNATAEAYFASLDDWEHHLAKPFARVEDTPQLLIALGVLLQGMNLSPGRTVLEFGAGSGWLSHGLTQLGCRAILMDVSATALEIARELYRRIPIVGERPEPQFLQYDGRRIALPDASVDRVLCFDAFHHAPNPDQVLAEFARVLRPGGIAAFAEPGPWHSTTPQSQFEMRTYGVVENDVNIHAIWNWASKAGFEDLRLAAFNVPPFHMTLGDYDDLLAGGPVFEAWAQATRTYLGAVRTFFLKMPGSEPLDSRRAERLRASISIELPTRSKPGEPLHGQVRVTNSGEAHWLPSSEAHGGVSLGAHLYDGEGRLVRFDHQWWDLPRALAPNEESSFPIELAPLPSGTHRIEFDCVARQVCWFGQTGSTTTWVEIVSS